MAVKATDVTLTGTITDDQGNLLNGTITITLQGYGATVPTIGGSQVLAGLSLTAAVTSGVFSTTFYSNQIITPGPLVTFYSVAFQQSATSVGTIFNFSQNYQFGAGSFDLSNLVPIGSTIPNKATATQVVPNVFAPQAHQFLNGLNATGSFSAAQPAASDLSNGATGSGLVVLATSPVLSGPTTNTLTMTAVAPTVAAAQIGLGSTTATSATAGSNGDVPAQVVGYIIINVAGTAMKIPYYNT